VWSALHLERKTGGDWQELRGFLDGWWLKIEVVRKCTTLVRKVCLVEIDSCLTDAEVSGRSAGLALCGAGATVVWSSSCRGVVHCLRVAEDCIFLSALQPIPAKTRGVNHARYKQCKIQLFLTIPYAVLKTLLQVLNCDARFETFFTHGSKLCSRSNYIFRIINIEK